MYVRCLDALDALDAGMLLDEQETSHQTGSGWECLDTLDAVRCMLDA